MKTLSYQIDKSAPDTSITIKKNVFKSILNKITFGLFFNESQDVGIEAEDKLSGVDKVYYFVSDKSLLIAEVNSITEWQAYSKKFSLAKNGEYVIYAKAVDKVGNVSYISSDGVVIDNVVPKISGIENDKKYYEDISFKVDEKYFDCVTLDGNIIASENEKYTVTADNKPHKIAVTDKAGNITELSVEVFKTYKVKLPSDNNGFEIKTSDEKTIHYCDSFTFSVSANKGFGRTSNYKVLVNGNEITETDGKYVINKISEDTVISVEGLLKYADYTAVNKAISSVPKDISKYTVDSANAIKKAVNAVIKDKFIDEQALVDGYASDIENAVKNLKLMPVSAEKPKEPEKISEPTNEPKNAPAINEDSKKSEEKQSENSPIIYLIVALGVLVVGGITVFTVVRVRKIIK